MGAGDKKKTNVKCSRGKNKCRAKKAGLKFRIGVYFDGTLNNMFNVKAGKAKRKAARAKARRNRARYVNPTKDDGSYNNDYTNVVHMWKASEPSTGYSYNGGKDGHYWQAFYIQGIGTEKTESDAKLWGARAGTGGTGIPARVHKALEAVAGLITKKAKERNVKTIDQVQIDVFGFSRGAAAARNFVHCVLKGQNLFWYKNRRLETWLKEKKLKLKKVEFTFVGLFDTVASYDKFGVDLDSDTVQLKLNTIGDKRVKRVVQLAAGEEHRKNFRLTNINSVPKTRGIELFLPGSHSDVGGGYRHNTAEKINVFFRAKKSFAGRKWLIAHGWADSNSELSAVALTPSSPPALQMHRTRISNRYHRFALVLMAHYARDAGCNYPSLPKWSNPMVGTRLALPKALRTCMEELTDYVVKHENDRTSKPDDWMDSKKGWHKTLRHDFLHYSAHWSDVIYIAGLWFYPHEPEPKGRVGYRCKRGINPG